MTDERPASSFDHRATEFRRSRESAVAEWTPVGPERAAELLAAAGPHLDPGHDDYFQAHRERLRQTLARLPEVPSGADAAAIDFSAYPATVSALADLGYRTSATFFAQGPTADRREASEEWRRAGLETEYWVDFERHRLDCPEDTFDLVLAAEIIEHLPTDPQQLLVEANRVLRPGGLVVVTTPNVVSWAAIARSLEHRHPFNYPLYDRHRSMDRHHLEFTPDLLARAVRGAGFELVELATPDVWEQPAPELVDRIRSAGFADDLRGDCLIAVGVKVSDVVDRTPPGLYTGDRSTHALAALVEPGREDS